MADKKDIVAQFVASAERHNIRPCFYVSPNSNAYLVKRTDAEGFVGAQLGMVRELLTNYGKNYVSRLWFADYLG